MARHLVQVAGSSEVASYYVIRPDSRPDAVGAQPAAFMDFVTIYVYFSMIAVETVLGLLENSLGVYFCGAEVETQRQRR